MKLTSKPVKVDAKMRDFVGCVACGLVCQVQISTRSKSSCSSVCETTWKGSVERHRKAVGQAQKDALRTLLRHATALKVAVDREVRTTIEFIGEQGCIWKNGITLRSQVVSEACLRFDDICIGKPAAELPKAGRAAMGDGAASTPLEQRGIICDSDGRPVRDIKVRVRV